MGYRKTEERDYFTHQNPFLQRIVDGEEPIARWYDLEPAELMRSLTRLGALRMAHDWVRDFDYEVRRRNREDRDTDAQGNPDPSYFFGWHNVELLGIDRREWPGLFD